MNLPSSMASKLGKPGLPAQKTQYKPLKTNFG